MTKDKLIDNLKNYKKNIASLELKNRELNRLLTRLEKIKKATPEITITSAIGINSDIRSKNKVGNKVENAVVDRATKFEELEAEIKSLKAEIEETHNNIEDVRIRLNALNYKERRFYRGILF